MIIQDLEFLSSSEEECDNSYFAVRGGASAIVSTETSTKKGAIGVEALAEASEDENSAIALTGVRLLPRSRTSFLSTEENIGTFGSLYRRPIGYSVSRYSSSSSVSDIS